MLKACAQKGRYTQLKREKNVHHLVKAPVTGFWVSAPLFYVFNSSILLYCLKDWLLAMNRPTIYLSFCTVANFLVGGYSSHPARRSL